MNILGNSIKEIRKSKKMTQNQLAELTGFKQNTISNHENGNRQLDETDIRKYAKALDVEPQQLFDKALSISTISPPVSDTARAISETVEKLEEPRRVIVLDTAKTQLDEQKQEKNKKRNDIAQLPKMYSYDYYDQPASAGTGQYLNDVKVEQVQLPIDVKADFVIPIYGDSMEPEYHSGDYVFIRLSVDLSDGDIGVFEYYGDAYIKQLIINEDGAFLHSFNSDYDDIPIDADSDFRIIGEVVNFYREN